MTTEQAERTGRVTDMAVGGSLPQPPINGVAENTVLAALMRTRLALAGALTILDELQGLDDLPKEAAPEATGVIGLSSVCEGLAEQLRDRTQVIRGHIDRL